MSIIRCTVLHSRPVGPPTPSDFRLEEVPIPVPTAGQLILRTLYLSLDPYMPGRMSDALSHAAPVALGEVVVGGTVSRVEASFDPHYEPGDLVVSYSGWQENALSDGTRLSRLAAACPQGMQGFLIFDDYGHRYPEFASQMGTWVNQGKIKYREDSVDRLEKAPASFIGLLAGKNFGKLVFRVATDAIS